VKMTSVRVQVVTKPNRHDILFPSQDLTYGSIVSVDDKTLELMKAIGVVFADGLDSARVLVGTIDVSAVKLIEMSRLLSFDKRSFPIYLVDQADNFLGLWQNGFWFDDRNANLDRIGECLEGVAMSPRPICLA